MKTPHTYIIAEAGVNHNGSLDLALKLVEAAAEAGADAVKFQTFRAEALVSTTAAKADYQIQATGAAETQFQMLKKLELDEAAHLALDAHCRTLGLQFLSTPFDHESLKFLDQRLGMPLIKIPSGEITNGPHLLAVARTGKPILLSTGMSTMPEVREALEVIAFGYMENERPPSRNAFRSVYRSAAGRRELKAMVTLLHCTSEYPAPFADVNLRAMDSMREEFELPVGLSDHTLGISIAIAAAARGAAVVEKHFTLDRSLPGPDHRASLEPGELRAMVGAIREVEQALGSGIKEPAPSEQKNISMARRSIVASREIVLGEQYSPQNLACKRPAAGASPMEYWEMLGRKAGRRYKPDEVIEP